MTGKARKHFLWTGVVLALLGFLPGTSRPAFGGLAALDSFHIGRYHLANGDRTKALDAFNDALRLNPQFVQAYVARGKLYAEMGQHESALVDLNFALRLQPTHAEAFAYRGFAQLSLGKFQDAMPDLDMALRIDPTYARVHFLRGQALKMLGEEQASATSIAMAKRLDPTLEISQVVTASANGSINDHALQINGLSASPQRTPITNDLIPDQRTTAVDRRMQGRLVPYQKHPILADVAPPSASRLPDGTQLPPGFSVEERPFLPRGGMSSGVLRGRRTTVIEDRAVPSTGKIPDLTSPPLGELPSGAKTGPSSTKGFSGPKLGHDSSGEKPVEAIPSQELPTTKRESIVAGGTTAMPVEAALDAEAANDAADEILDLIPLPTTADLLTILPFDFDPTSESQSGVTQLPAIAPAELPEETTVAAPAVTPGSASPAVVSSTVAPAPEAPKGVLGDMGMPSTVMVGEAAPVVASKTPAGLPAPAATEPTPIANAAPPVLIPLPPIAPMEMPEETVAATPATAAVKNPATMPEAPKGVLGDMGVTSTVMVGEAAPVVAPAAPVGLPAPAATEPTPIANAAAPIVAPALPVEPAAPTVVTDTAAAPKIASIEAPATPELTASEILKRRQSQGFVLPSKSSEDQRRLAGAIDSARASLTPGMSTIIGDEAVEPAVTATQPAPVKISAEVAQVADVEYRRGLKLEAEGDLNSAIAAYRQSIEINPTDPQVYCRRGHLLVESQRTAEALADFNEAVKLAPGLSNGYFGRAHVRYVTQQFADACDDYAIAIRLDDQHAQALIERGHCLAMLGDLNAAKSDREAALALDPSLAKHGPKYALGNTEAVAATKPDMNGATAFAGDAPSGVAAKPEAVVTANAVTANPAASQASAASRIGSAFDDMFVASTPNAAGGVSNISKLSEARAAIASDDQASAIVSDDANFAASPVTPATTTGPIAAPVVPAVTPPAVLPPMDMSDAAMASDEVEDTKNDKAKQIVAPARDRATLEADRKRLTEELAANPGDAVRYYERARTSQELGDAAAAFDDVTVALRLNPAHADALRLRATLNSANGKFAEALVDLDGVLRLNPGDAAASSERGYARLATGRTNEAIADLTDALKASPDDVASLCRRGMAYALLADRARALADFDAAQRAAPQDAEVVLCRAKAHAEFGNKREAVADLNAAIKLNPQSAEAYYERSRLYAERGAYENAQADRRKAMELDPTVVR